jgi:ribosomal protein S18 acetylase RimI-like enzyme
MATFELAGRTTDTDVLCQTSVPPASRDDQRWALRGVEPMDLTTVKALFHKLHAFNASLDPRFALSEDWETHFDAAMEEALRGRESLCLIARERQSGQTGGFVLAAIHHDSRMWRHRDWVEVEALYVEDAWRGQGLAATLLTHACEWAERIGQPVVQLYVTASNARAIRFYRREGFREAQTIMRKALA